MYLNVKYMGMSCFVWFSECADSLDTLSDKERASLLAVQAMCTLSKILVGNDHVGHSTEQLLRTARSKIFSKIGIEDEAWSPNTNYCICLVSIFMLPLSVFYYCLMT